MGKRSRFRRERRENPKREATHADFVGLHDRIERLVMDFAMRFDPPAELTSEGDEGCDPTLPILPCLQVVAEYLEVVGMDFMDVRMITGHMWDAVLERVGDQDPRRRSTFFDLRDEMQAAVDGAESVSLDDLRARAMSIRVDANGAKP